MRKYILITTIAVTVFYLMTGLVYSEGGFDAALVLKPYPMIDLVFGGGEEGAWARNHLGQELPWFQQNNLSVIYRFSWEEGSPIWVSAYSMGFLSVLLAWLSFAFIFITKLIKFLFSKIKI